MLVQGWPLFALSICARVLRRFGFLLGGLWGEHSEPAFTVLFCGQFKVLALDNSGGIATFQGHPGNVMGHGNPVADVGVSEFVGSDIDSLAFAVAVKRLE
jgi:hypothetical protein